jgi:hypothetical protein
MQLDPVEQAIPAPIWRGDSARCQERHG